MGEARRRPRGDRAEVAKLKAALKPFTRFTHERDPMKRAQHEVFVPTEGDVWFYVGEAEQVGKAHLHTDDFKRAKRAMR